jgi:hypothetical protein
MEYSVCLGGCVVGGFLRLFIAPRTVIHSAHRRKQK